MILHEFTSGSFYKEEVIMERLTVFIEHSMQNKYVLWLITFISIVAPVYFLRTVWDVWFGPPEVLLGFQTQRYVLLVLVISDSVAFLTTLPARKKGRIMQLIMFAWAVEMALLTIATFIL